jgi:hypothetical protein
MIQVHLAAVNETVEVNENDWTICSDSLCDGYQPILVEDSDGNNMPETFKTEEEAIKEMEDDPEFYEDCFPCQMSEIGHKIVFYGKA